MKVFTWGACLYFIHTGFYNILFLKTWRKCLYLTVKSLFLHFISTDIHQNLELYSSLYYEGLYRRICLYFIHTGFYNISFLQTWRKCLYLKVINLFLHFSSTDIHQNLELYSSLYYEGFYLRDLFIFHSHWFLQYFIPKNMAKMPIFKGKEFVSPLQQHWHTPKLRVVFLSILWRFLPRDLFIFHSHWFLQIFIPKNMAKMPIFKGKVVCFSTSAALTYTKTYSCIPLYIMKVLPRDLFIFHSHWFLQHFIPTNMAKMPIFKGN